MKKNYSFSKSRILVFMVVFTFSSFVSRANIVPALVSGLSVGSDTVGASVIISGSNFNSIFSNNIVFFGAVQASVSGGSASTLIVTVPHGATYGYVSVTDLVNGTTAYSTQPFTVQYPCGGIIDTAAFAPKMGYPTGTLPKNIAMGDFNGDGQPDLAVTNYGTNTVSVYKNTSSNGIISFDPLANFATNANPSGLAIGDLDGDGKLDLAVANWGNGNVSLFKNQSTINSISFATKIDDSVGVWPTSIDINDLDLDGRPEVIVTNNLSHSISILKNTSSGGSISFAAKADFSTGTTSPSPTGIKVGDLDADGKPDIVVSNSASNTIAVFKNTSDTSIQLNPYINLNVAAQQPVDVALADLNNDNKLDIVVASKNGNGISIFKNTSSFPIITFDTASIFIAAPTGAKPDNIRIADIDGDSKPDITIGYDGIDAFSVLKNFSSGGSISMGNLTQYPITTGKHSLAVGDLNGDGKPDVAAVNYDSAKVFLFPNKISSVPPPNIVTNSPVCAGQTLNFTTDTLFGGTYEWSGPGGYTSHIRNTIRPNVSDSASGVYTLVTHMGNCSSNPKTVNVIVKQTPDVTASPSSQAICSGDTLISHLITTHDSTTFSWTVSSTGVLGAVADTGHKISQILTTINTSNSIVLYTIKPYRNGCVGDSIVLADTVKPIPTATISSVNNTTCSGQAVTVPISSNIAGTIFLWTFVQTNVLGATADSGSTLVQILSDTSTVQGIAAYTITPKSQNCSGLQIQDTIFVNPLPKLTSVLADTICTNSYTSINLTANIPSTFHWSIGTITGGIIGASNDTGSVIHQQLKNPSNTTAGTVQYIVSSTSNAYSCTGIDDTITVTVNPSPVLTNPTSKSICGNTFTDINLISSTPSTYTWSGSLISGNVLGFGTGVDSTINQQLVNTDTTVGTVNYTITITSIEGNCMADSNGVIQVIVRPQPIVTAGIDDTICAGESATLHAHGALTYLWSNSSTTDSILVSPTATTTYIVTGTADNSCSKADTVIVNVNNLPTVNAGSDISICAGQDTMLTGTGTAITYTWNYGITNGVSFTADSTRTYTLTGVDANNCVQKDSLILTVNNLPIVDAGLNDTVCSGEHITLTGAGNATSYAWNNGVNDGVTFTIYTSYTYKVIGTNSNNCSQSDSIVVTVNNLPSVIAGVDQTICSGQSVTVAASGSTAIYTWNNGVINNTAFSPDSTKTYVVTATDSNHCVQSDSLVVVVNQSPTANAGVDTAICFSDSLSLIGLGGVTYVWEEGSNTYTSSVIAISPTATTSYTLTVTDNVGCTDNDTVVVTVNQSKNINGHASYSGGNVTSGTAMLFKYLPFDTRFDTVQIATIDAQGNYSFTGINDGQYIVAAIPNTSDSMLVTTYYSSDSAYLWNDSSVLVINHGCLADATLADLIMVEQLGTGGGPGLITGQILQGLGFGRNEGEPIPGVDIKLGKNPGGALMKNTSTDSSGNYTFSNVAFGNYTIYVDIPGLGRDSSYTITIDSLNNQYPNLNYKADSTSIYLNPSSTTGINTIVLNSEIKLNVYPNPIKGTATIEYSILSNKEQKVALDIYNILGMKISTLINANQQNGTYKVYFNSENNNLNSGIYFIRLAVDGKIITKRVVVTE
jgi:hypothetical protein